MDARRTALAILHRVLREDAYSNLALDAAFARHPEADPADKRLATQLVYGVLRRLAALDAEIARLSSKPLSKLDDAVLDTLRLALYQLDELERIPPHAVLSEAGRLLLSARKRSAQGFVNALLRRHLAERETGRPPAARTDTFAALSVAASLPLFVLEAWAREPELAALPAAERMAAVAARAFLQNEPAPFTLAVLLQRVSMEAAVAALTRAGAECVPGRFCPQALTLTRGGRDAAQALLEKGQAVVMDEAAQLVVALAGAKEGERVLDVCAAPGGKALLLAEAVGPTGKVVACDIAPNKLDLLAEQAKRRGLAQLSTLPADARLPLPGVPLHAFDVVLVDAPCSALGLLRRHPEIRYRREAKAIAPLAECAFAIAQNALNYLAPGGRLVFSVCTTSEEEGPEQIPKLLAAAPALRLRSAEIARELWSEGPQGPYFSTRQAPELDGFFAVVLS